MFTHAFSHVIKSYMNLYVSAAYKPDHKRPVTCPDLCLGGPLMSGSRAPDQNIHHAVLTRLVYLMITDFSTLPNIDTLLSLVSFCSLKLPCLQGGLVRFFYFLSLWSNYTRMIQFYFF